jgi:hypothetical protein
LYLEFVIDLQEIHSAPDFGQEQGFLLDMTIIWPGRTMNITIFQFIAIKVGTLLVRSDQDQTPHLSVVFLGYSVQSQNSLYSSPQYTIINCQKDQITFVTQGIQQSPTLT